MTDIEISLEPDAGDAEVGRVVAGLVRFNGGHAGPEGWQRLVLLVRSAEGEVLGGLLGFTHWDWLFVSHLWVEDQLRGRGVGRKLLDQAEMEAARRGCTHAHLDTFSFQARAFYESNGYEVFGTLDDYPPGHARFFMVKHRLASG